MTNLSAEVSAILICEAYRDRWQIEGHFQRLTDLLYCEVPTLSHPRAALFAFAMSVVAGNAVALLEGNLCAVHGEEEAMPVGSAGATGGSPAVRLGRRQR